LKLGADLLPIEGGEVEADAPAEAQPPPTLEDVQRQHVLRVLEQTGWRISGPNGAAAILDLHANTLQSLMKRLGIRRPTRGQP
jgi:transcriptional regulator with GAF, ATPase, and Fis domain